MNSIDFNSPKEQRNSTSVFYGINKGARIPDGYFSELRNMTSSKYPCLAVRPGRKKIIYDTDVSLPGEPCDAAVCGDSIIFSCTNGIVVYGAEQIDTRGEVKDIIPFGNKVYCSPSGVLIEKNDIKFSRISIQDIFDISYCDSSTESIDVTTGEKPSAPANGQYWYDGKNSGLYRYSAASEGWMSVATMYIRCKPSVADITVFNPGDSVRITAGEKIYEAFISDVFSESLIFEGVFDSSIISAETLLIIERRFPVLQFACAHNNRIWGCNYDGDINEIYASKLGDPLNWYSYRGLSTDSYAVSCGEYGEFTGCAQLGDSVVFFKEYCIYTVYGSEPSSFCTVKTDCFGVQKGSERSLVRINGILFYKSCHGIMRLSEGSLPVCISDDIGADVFSSAVAGTDGRKYYIVMTDMQGKREMYVYDTVYQVWHKEDVPCEDFFAFCNYKNNLLCIGKKATSAKAMPKKMKIKAAYPDRKDYSDPAAYSVALAVYLGRYLVGSLLMQKNIEEIRALIAESKNKDTSEISDRDVSEYMSEFLEVEDTYEHLLRLAYISDEVSCNAFLPVLAYAGYKLSDEGRFMWSATTGIRGFEASEYKRLKGIEIRMKLQNSARCDVSIQYDDTGSFESIATFDSEGMTTYRMTGRLNKCDVFRLRFRGFGKAVIYSISEIYEEAGNSGF